MATSHVLIIYSAIAHTTSFLVMPAYIVQSHPHNSTFLPRQLPQLPMPLAARNCKAFICGTEATYMYINYNATGGYSHTETEHY